MDPGAVRPDPGGLVPHRGVVFPAVPELPGGVEELGGALIAAPVRGLVLQ
jgi:hypothetical protein